MLSVEIIKDIRQVRMNELSAKFVHQKLLRLPQAGNRAVDILTFIIPILYFAPKLIWTEMPALRVIGIIDVLLLVILLAIAVLRKVLGWDEQLQGHRAAITRNIRTSNQALEFLMDENANDNAAKWFLRLAKEPDTIEQRLLERVKASQKQTAYREALKEFYPTAQNAICQICGASVWHYHTGSCQTCGGTPPKKGV